MAGDGTPGPVIVLVEPQLGENIGMAARAMLNCRLTELRLVKPRDGWPSDEATAAAAGDRQRDFRRRRRPHAALAHVATQSTARNSQEPLT